MEGDGRSLHHCILETLPTQNLRATHKSKALPAASASDHSLTTLSGPNFQVPLHFKSFTPSLTSITFHNHCYCSNSGFDIHVPGFTARGFYWIPSFSYQSLYLSASKCLFLEHHYLHVMLTHQHSMAFYYLEMVVQRNIKSMDSEAGPSGLHPWFCHLLTLLLWANYLASLCLSVLLLK